MALSTKLTAVNIMLQVIGESKVSSLASGDLDAESAEDVLDEISTEFQVQGWRFNEEIRTLAADQNGEVWLPANTLQADVTDRADNHLVQRGSKFYDSINNTYNLSRSLETRLILLLDFEELPQPARRYIEIRAARVFQKRTLGAVEVDQFTAEDENKAWLAFLDYIGSTEDYNIFQNQEMAENIDRRITGGSSWLL